MAADGRKKNLFWGSVTYLDELISLGLVDLGICKPESNLSDALFHRRWYIFIVSVKSLIWIVFQIVRLLLRANTLVLCHLLVGSVLPSLSSCVLLRAVCCAVTRKFSNYLLVLFWFGCLHHFCHSFSTETLWRNLFYQEQQTSCLFVAVCCFNLFVVLV